MNSWRRLGALAALAAVAALAVGCGETVIDDVKTAETVKSSLEKSLHAKITSVDCPSDVKVEAGNTFACAVKFSDGTQAIVTLKIRNDNADTSIVGLKPKN